MRPGEAFGPGNRYDHNQNDCLHPSRPGTGREPAGGSASSLPPAQGRLAAPDMEVVVPHCHDMYRLALGAFALFAVLEPHLPDMAAATGNLHADRCTKGIEIDPVIVLLVVQQHQHPFPAS